MSDKTLATIVTPELGSSCDAHPAEEAKSLLLLNTPTGTVAYYFCADCEKDWKLDGTINDYTIESRDECDGCGAFGLLKGVYKNETFLMLCNTCNDDEG
jgi:hypothetical protein